MAASALGGYDEAFVDSPDDDWGCPICLTVARDPVLTSCGHIFCKGCFETLKRKDDKVECPEDREKLGKDDIFLDKRTKRKILQLRVKCREHTSGCTKIIALQYLEEHLVVCDYVVVPCPNECEKKMQRSALAEHKRWFCLRRRVLCEHCCIQMEFQKIKDHQLQVCTQFPVTCRLCSKQMARSKLDGHCSVRGDCPKTVIDCEYKDIGCQFKCERELLFAHLQENMGKHMKLLHQNHKELKEGQVKEIQVLHKENKELKLKGQYLHEEVKVLHEEVKLLRKKNKEVEEHYMDEMKNHKKDLQLLKEQHEKEMQQIKEEIRHGWPKEEREIPELPRRLVQAAEEEYECDEEEYECDEEEYERDEEEYECDEEEHECDEEEYECDEEEYECDEEENECDEEEYECDEAD